MAVLVLGYYRLLRSILRAKPHLRRRLTRCRRCRIFFLAHACNAGRHDLRCPFGCQEAHWRRESTKRSVAYYRDEVGRVKKQIQNGKRGWGQGKPVEPAAPAGAEPSAAMVKHLQSVLSGIEGRRVSREEVLALWMRQHSLAAGAPVRDTAARCDERPP